MLNVNKKKFFVLSNEKRLLFESLKNKTIPTKYLYDDEGSRLFEKICNTTEYYLTRTEKKILDNYSKNIIDLANTNEFFELGSGSSKKTKILIAQALKKLNRLKYISFDISDKALELSYHELRNISDKLDIQLIRGDFLNDLDKMKSNNNRMYLFLGSTIGNFNNELAVKFLSNLSTIMKTKDSLLIGIDKVKDKKIIISAYNDQDGITEKFNKNILNVINKKYDLNFYPENFIHEAIFNEEKNQIEMYLKSKVNQNIYFSDNEKIYLNKGDIILTEICRKFTDASIASLFKKSSLKIVESFSDENNYFLLYLLRKL